jgi:hypothetical protein
MKIARPELDAVQSTQAQLSPDIWQSGDVAHAEWASFVII